MMAVAMTRKLTTAKYAFGLRFTIGTGIALDVYSHVTRRLEDEVAESFDRKFNKPNEKRRSDS